MDAIELVAARHGCKVCGKSFPCGRSHLSLGEAAAAAEVDADDELRRASANGGRSFNGAVVGYGLRENPRKTRWLSDFADDDEEEEDGGDGDGDGEHKACWECGKLFTSWRPLFGHMRRHASGGRDRDGEEDVDVDEDFVPEKVEAEEVEMVVPMEAPVTAPAVVLATAPRRRRRSMRVAATAPAPPLVLSGSEKEQEDVALCLLMLSRDTGLWSSPVKEETFAKGNEHRRKATTKQARLPRNGHAYNSDDESALLQYGDAKIKSGGGGGGGNGVAKSRKRSSPKQQCAAAAPKRTRYECPGCGKVFSSYQALGGHRASHKRMNNSCSAPKVATAPAPEPSAETETYASFNTPSPSASPDSVAIGISKAKCLTEAAAGEKFECTVCFRVFASGQALGGHKRSHVIPDDGEHYAGGADQEQHPAAVAVFLDLNFPPAPAEEA